MECVECVECPQKKVSVECVTSCGGVVEVALWRCGICDVMWRYCGGVVVVVAVEMVLLLLLLWASV